MRPSRGCTLLAAGNEIAKRSGPELSARGTTASAATVIATSPTGRSRSRCIARLLRMIGEANTKSAGTGHPLTVDNRAFPTTDPVSLGVVAALLIAVAPAATAIPASQAIRISPVTILRGDS